MMLAGMGCGICGEMTNGDDLVWVVMGNPDLNVKMQVYYGSHKLACKRCKEQYDLPVWNRPKKVSISVLRDTRDVLRELKRELKNERESERVRVREGSYDDLFAHLIKKAGYGELYKELYAKLHNLDKEKLQQFRR
jgi:hypothetical protein